MDESNKAAHHTDVFNTSELILRRGQSCRLTLEFSKPLRDWQSIVFIARTGPTSSAYQNTNVEFSLSSSWSSGTWSAVLESNPGNSLKIIMSSPANAVIGRYDLSVRITVMEQTATYSLGKFILLFNPWCLDDEVYMANEEERREYVLNDHGVIFMGNEKHVTGMGWNYGQFESEILNICLDILDRSLNCQKDAAADYSQRHSPSYVGRVISAMINSNDDFGVLEGKWEKDFSDGADPNSWNGSVEILRKWKADDYKPVKYGQCWVFAAVMCTALRGLGIPTRVITNFNSAHNTDGNMAIDMYYDPEGKFLEMSDDSIWNFHVWNESWFMRRDLGHRYNGWQVLDSTPQEQSQGLYQCGPASVIAVKEGDVHLGIDTPFVFAEVNADRHTWVVQKDGSKERAYSDSKYVGQSISTKAVGSDSRVDVTHNYKYPEGSPQERKIFEKASRNMLLYTPPEENVTESRNNMMSRSRNDPVVRSTPNLTDAATRSPSSTLPLTDRSSSPSRFPGRSSSLSRPSSALPSAGRSSTPLPTEGRSSTPIPSEGRSSTPIPSEGRSSTPIPSEGRSSTPLPMEGRSSAPMPSEGHSSSPLPSAGRSSSPYPSADRSSSPYPPADRSSSPYPPADRPSSSYPPADRSSSPYPPADRSSSPYPSADRSSSPYPSADRSSSPYPSADRSSSPYPSADRSSSPYRSPDRPSSPYPSADRSSSPYPSADRSSSPYPSANRSSSPYPSAGRSSSPLPSAGRSSSPYPRADRSSSPLPSAGRSSSALPSSGRTSQPSAGNDYRPSTSSRSGRSSSPAGHPSNSPSRNDFLSASSNSAAERRGRSLSRGPASGRPSDSSRSLNDYKPSSPSPSVPKPVASGPDVAGKFRLLSPLVVGDDIILLLVLKNLTPYLRPVKVNLSASCVLYTGRRVNDIFTDRKSLIISPNQDAHISLQIPYSQYMKCHNYGNMIQVVALCELPFGEKVVVTKDLVLDNPQIIIKAFSPGILNKTMNLEIRVANPLSIAVTDCTLVVEGSGLVDRQLTAVVPYLRPKEKIRFRVELTPYRTGTRQLIANFKCKYFSIKGYQLINVESW